MVFNTKEIGSGWNINNLTSDPPRIKAIWNTPNNGIIDIDSYRDCFYPILYEDDVEGEYYLLYLSKNPSVCKYNNIMVWLDKETGLPIEYFNN